MTPHPEEGALQEFLDGELGPDRREALVDHLERCAACRLRLGELAGMAGVLTEALPLVDLPVPDVGAARWSVRRTNAARRSAHRRRHLSAAASVALLFGVGVAASVPGSPVRSWWEARFVDDVVGVAALSAPAPDEAPQEGVAAAGAAAVSVPLEDGRITVELNGVPVGAPVEILLVGGVQGWVTAPSGARFTSAAGRIHVELDGLPGEIRVEFPAAATEGGLTVNGVSVLQGTLLPGEEGTRLEVEAPSGTSPGGAG